MLDASKSEPLPTGQGAKVLPFVLRQLQLRADEGRQKYGTYLRTDNGRDALMDAFQEALDLCMYLGQALLEREINGSHDS